MKWIRWDDGRFETKETLEEHRALRRLWPKDVIDCEKDGNWREIESGVLDTETGKLRITLKPVVQKEQVANVEIRFPARDDHDSLVVYGFCNDGSFCRTVAHRDSRLWREVFDAENEFGNVSRAAQASTPTNPYTKEAVDELLEAAEKSDSGLLDESVWSREWNKRAVRALLALKKQREAANGG